MKNNTLDYYNNNAETYVSKTINSDMSKLCDEFLNFLQPNSLILDVGCGSGRDSLYFKNKGHRVVAMDGSKEICKIAQNVLKQPVLCMDILDINFNDKFDGVWACASLLHAKKSDLPQIFTNIYNSLKLDGIFNFSAKFGDSERTDELDRNFTDFNKPFLQNMLEEISPSAKFKLEDYSETGDTLNRNDTTWCNFMLKKEQVMEHDHDCEYDCLER